MAGAVIPDPRGGHVWIYGVDAGGDPVKVLVDAAGSLQIDTVTSALPAGAATAAAQATALTELQQKLETGDLNLDESGNVGVVAPGGDRIFNLESCVEVGGFDSSASAGSDTKNSNAVPSGKIWVITHIAALDNTGAIDAIVFYRIKNGGWYPVSGRLSLATGEFAVWGGELHLTAGELIRIIFVGTAVGDDLFWSISGYQMDAP